MSDNELLLKVKADTDKATKEIGRLSKQVGVLTKETDKSKKSLKNQDTQLKNIAKSSKGVSDTFKKITLGLGLMGVALKAVEFTKLAADAAQSADAFDKVVTDMGENSVEVFNEIKEAAQGLIPDAEIKQSATTALSLGVPLEKLAQLMEVARAKSREMGTDASKAFADLATGIGRGSPMILDNLGLTIKLGDANQKMAGSLGKTVKELTKQEKTLALTNAVIDAGAKSIKRYADASLTSKEKTQKFEASLENLKVKIGNELLSPFTKLTEQMTKWIDSLDSDSISAFGDAVGGLFSAVGLLVGAVSDLNDILIPDWLAGENVGLIDGTAKAINHVSEAVKNVSEQMKDVSDGGGGGGSSWGEDIAKNSKTAEEATKSLSKTVEKLSEEQIKALDKLNKTRVKDAEKTLKTLSKNESKLSKDILKINERLAKELKSIENDRLESQVGLNTQIQELQRSGLSEKEAYYQKEKDADKLLSDAKRALISGDLDAYKTYADAYRSLVQKNGDKAITKNGAILVSADEVRKNSIQNLKDLGGLENQYYNQKKTSAQAVHDQEIAFKKIELDLIKLNIEAQLELIKLASQPKGVPVDSTALDAVLLKIDGLKTGLTSIQNIPATVRTDTTQIDTAKQKIEEIKTLTLNGTTLQVDSDTTAADFGIQKLITKIGKNDVITMEVNPEYTKAEDELNNFRENASNVDIETQVTADTSEAETALTKLAKPTKSEHKVGANTSQAQSAINNLKKPTSSVHTVYVKEVHSRANGGPIPQKLATGGKFRGSGKVPGYDATDSDSVNAVLTKGEYVIKRKAVDKIGVAALHAINTLKMPKLPGYADGGVVGGTASSQTSVAAAQTPINLNIGGKTFKVMSDLEVAEALTRHINTQGGF